MFPSRPTHHLCYGCNIRRKCACKNVTVKNDMSHHTSKTHCTINLKKSYVVNSFHSTLTFAHLHVCHYTVYFQRLRQHFYDQCYKYYLRNCHDVLHMLIVGVLIAENVDIYDIVNL